MTDLRAVPSPRRPVQARRPSRRAEPWRDCVLIGAYVHAVLLAAALWRPDGLALVAVAVLLGGGFATGTLTVLHDAGHRMFARSTWPNVLAVQLAVPAGLWVGHWTLKHRVHHKFSVVYGLDESTRSAAVLRLHPEAPLLPVHRYQHLYGWALYGLAWAGELKSQLTYLRTGHVTETETPPFASRLGSFLLEKGLCAVVLAPYAWRLGLLRTVVLLLVAETVGSLLAAVMTVVGHVNVGLEAVPGLPGADWAAHLVRTTASFQTRSVLVRFWTGGLTHHLAHHLRPVALRSELPALHDTTVQTVVAASGEPLAEFPTFRAAVAAHYRRLQELGTPAADRSARPAAAAAR